MLREGAVDLALLAVVLPMALKSAKLWPLVAAALCLVMLMTAAAQLLVHATPQAYAIAGMAGGAADIVVALGAWNAWRAGRRGAGRPPERTTDPA